MCDHQKLIGGLEYGLRLPLSVVFTGEHFVVTFAPIVRVISIRTLLALAAYNDWEVEQLDMVTAFLEADIEEEIYMRRPEGFRHTDINGEERVCLLKKSLYGLKQAPRNMNKTFTSEHG
jgi:hypothetical protein